MSRRDYEAIAKILRAELAISEVTGDGSAMTAVENITASMADHFAQENSRFNRVFFYMAALGRVHVRKPLSSI